jgi:hypothetical protein
LGDQRQAQTALMEVEKTKEKGGKQIDVAKLCCSEKQIYKTLLSDSLNAFLLSKQGKWNAHISVFIIPLNVSTTSH